MRYATWLQVGALVVDDVTASELMKIRLLNGGHSAISYISYLLGHRDVDKSMADPRIANFLRAYFAEVRVALGLRLGRRLSSSLQRVQRTRFAGRTLSSAFVSPRFARAYQ
jgi:mannitol-1-phosphate/altronate dehydrogenase